MPKKSRSGRSALITAIAVFALFIGLDIVGLNPLSERGSIVGRGSGGEGGCGGYEGEYTANVSFSVPTIGRSEESLFVGRSSVWDSPIIPVCWENPSDDDDEPRGWVEDAVAMSWQAVSGLEFRDWGPCEDASEGIRIRIDDSGPRVTKLGKAVNGVTDGMFLNFEFENWSTSCRSRKEYCIRTVAIHEFGHAIGFVHEQNRVDSKCHGKEQGSVGDQMIGPWDLDSVMNYCNPNWSGGGQLSTIDIMGVQQVYGKSEDGLRDLFEICSQEESQGWQAPCDDPASFTDDFNGSCRCQGDLLAESVTGEIICDGGNPNCTTRPLHDSTQKPTLVSSDFRTLYQECDELRAKSYWFDSCDSPAVRDPAMFAGDCSCVGDVYRHKMSGLFVCDRLPLACGGQLRIPPLGHFERVPAVLYANPALMTLYRRCNLIRHLVGDWHDCTIPALDDPSLFNELCGCEEPLVLHKASGLYQCPRLLDTCGGLEFEPDSDEYDLDNAECYALKNGEDYRGTISTTVDDEDCLPWEDVLGEETIDAIIPELGSHNSCRTVRDKRKSKPFCFTSVEPAEWAYCNVGQPASVCLDSELYPCAPMPCSNGARCVDLGDGDHRCVCRAGTQGGDCSTLSDNWCNGVNCGENGTCEPLLDGYTCKCGDGFLGRHCESALPPSKPTPFLPGDEMFVEQGCSDCSQAPVNLPALLLAFLFCGMRCRRKRAV